MTKLYCIALLGFSAACGPSTSGDTPGAGGQSGGVAMSNGGSEESSESSTGPGLDCSVVVEGNLTVYDELDRAWLATVREVQGNLMVMNLSDSAHLDELQCLEVVGGWLRLHDNPDLVDLAGLGRLREFSGGTGLHILRNPRLESLGGLTALEEVRGIEILSNPRLERLELQGVRSIGQFLIGSGSCPDPPPPRGEPTGPREFSGDNPSLKELGPLDALERMGSLAVQGQSGFISTAPLPEFARANHEELGGIGQSTNFTFMGNPSLPEAEVEAVYNAQDNYRISKGEACENGDERRECTCDLQPNE